MKYTCDIYQPKKRVRTSVPGLSRILPWRYTVYFFCKVHQTGLSLAPFSPLQSLRVRLTVQHSQFLFKSVISGRVLLALLLHGPNVRPTYQVILCYHFFSLLLSRCDGALDTYGVYEHERHHALAVILFMTWLKVISWPIYAVWYFLLQASE